MLTLTASKVGEGLMGETWARFFQPSRLRSGPSAASFDRFEHDGDRLSTPRSMGSYRWLSTSATHDLIGLTAVAAA